MPGNKKINAFKALLSIAVFLTCPIEASFAEGVPQGWVKFCTKDKNGQSICNTLNNVLSETGQPLTTINAVDYTEKGKPRRLQITVPTGRLVQEGVRIQIDNAPAKKMEYLFCIGLSCMAEGELSDSLLKALKNGSKMTVTSVNFEGDANPIDVSLKGFGKAFTGPEMQPAALEEQRRKLIEAVDAREKDINSKIKSAQDRAKNTK